MGLLDRVESELHASMKAGDELTVSTLRMLKTDIMYEKGKTGKDLSDEKVLEVIARAGKKRKEAIVEFEKAGRTDLADKEKSELSIIEKYLPKQLSTDEIAALIDKKIAENGLPSPSEKGKFMGIIMKELKGLADGTVVKEILEKKISG